MSSPPPPIGSTLDPHSVHSDYGEALRPQDSLARRETLPRPGRGRPRKNVSQTPRTGSSSTSTLRRMAPRSSLAPSDATAVGDNPSANTAASLLVFKCPIQGCERLYATKLALKRHFQVYQHEALFDGPLESVLRESSSTTEGDALVTKMLPKFYKCPLLSCYERFPTENELVAHWRHAHPTHKSSSIGEWITLIDEFDNIPLTPVEHPATFIKELENSPNVEQVEATWQFHSIFQVLGPQPALKIASVIAQLRHRLSAAFTAQTTTLDVDETLFGLILQLTLHELAPKGFLLTRDPDPARAATSPAYDVWNDEPWLRAIEAESAQTLLRFGSAHTARAALKRKTAGGENSEGGDEPPPLEAIEDRFVCQVPGCQKVFASLPAYKYHMHHYEHDMEILIRCSRLLRRILFAPLVPGEDLPETAGPGAFLPERWVLRLGPMPPRRSIVDRMICFPDVIHILHGYIDQQLPLLFSFHFSKRRGTLSPLAGAGEFLMVLKRDEDPSMVRRDLIEMLTERRSRDLRRKATEHESNISTSFSFQTTAAPFQTRNNGITGMVGADDEATQRSHISLLCKFVMPQQLDRFQSRRTLASVGGLPPGTMASATAPLAVSPVPAGLSLSSLVSSSLSNEQTSGLDEAGEKTPLPLPAHLNVLGIAEPSGDANIMAQSELVPLSGLHLSATDAIIYGDGMPFSSADFFPLIAISDSLPVAWIAIGGERNSISLWAIFLSFDALTLSYRIAAAPQLHCTILLSSVKNESESTQCVVALRFCPFIFETQSLSNRKIMDVLAAEGTRALLAVLDSSGSISLLSLPTASILLQPNGNFPSPTLYPTQELEVQPIATLTIPSYAITCFCWCKVPSQPLRIVVGTREGYIGLFDLSDISSPVLLLLSPGHPTVVASIDWCVSDPNRIVTASLDNSVVMWELDNMYQRCALLQSRLPFLAASWMHVLPPPIGTPPEVPPLNSVAWDAQGAVIAVDESNLAKIVLLGEPGRVITLASAAPRMWVSVSPNARFGGTLLAMANWAGKIELFGTPDPRSKKGDSANIATWTFNRDSRIFSVTLPPAVDNNGETVSNCELNDPMEWIQIIWHSVPIGLFAVVAATGLVHIHCS